MSAGAVEQERSAARIRLVDPAADPRWDAFVRSRPDATVYQLSAWSRMVREAYRFTPCSLALEDDRGELRGVLPLAAKHGRVTGRRMRSLPAAQVAGPLADTDADVARLIAAACDLAGQRGSALSVSSRIPGLEEIEPRLGVEPVGPTWILPIPATPEDREAWLAARSKNLRRGIARARKDGVTIRLARDGADLRTFHRLYLLTMRRHRSVPRTLRQLKVSRRLLEPEGIFRLFLAEHEGRVVAGALFHAFNGTLELLYNSSDPESLPHRPNHALYAGVIDWGAERGFSRMDFGNAWKESSLGEFKASWGAEPVPQFRYFDAGQGGPGPDPGAQVDQARKRLGDVVDRAWRRTPLALTAAAGTIGYRYL